MTANQFSTNQVHASTSSRGWEAVEDVLKKHTFEPDLQAVRVAYAAVAAHTLIGPPVWAMLVAPPGSFKTETVSALDGLANTYFIDQLTPRTFISGQIQDDKKKSQCSPSLLNRVGSSATFIYSDFSTVLAMQRDNRASVLSDMRRIYDGRLTKEFGTGESKKEHGWKGRVTFLVAATPDVDSHYSIFQTLGERFLMVRYARAGGVEAAMKAMNQDQGEMKRALKLAVAGMFSGIGKYEPHVPEDAQIQIAQLAEFAVRGRTQVPRNGYNKEILYLPEAESATRLAQQLIQLAKGSALLANRSIAAHEDVTLAARAAFDSVPAKRMAVLAPLLEGKSTSDVRLPSTTLTYCIEDLECVGLMVGQQLTEITKAVAPFRVSPLTTCTP